ncbi:MAG TPA: L,D-transpeptidase family protein [Sphingomicrobium sp.]|jgi:hypothetical protein|nr:L,D-transpeptidase family protein [Sphingomicrobium sp.]
MRLIALGLAAALLATPLAAQEVKRGGRPILAVATQLKNGEFVWAPELAPSGPVLVVVNLATQRLVVFRGGVPIGASTVSSGKDGYETPTGVFTILQKAKEHYSRTYDNAPMPNMQRLTWKGIALHAGNLPGYPASHGCIRLPTKFSSLLFGTTSLGMTVVITSLDVAPETSPPPALSLPAGGSLSNAAYEWHAGRAGRGIVSVVVSTTDQRAIVLQDGVEIGSAPVRYSGELAAPVAYVLRGRESGKNEWLKLYYSGSGGSMDVASDEASRFDAPTTFRRQLADLLRPGSIVIVTPRPLSAGSPGSSLTVIENDESPR